MWYQKLPDLTSTLKHVIFTVCNEVAKVMFLQVCVCPRGGGGGIPACLAGGIPTCLAAGLQGGGIPACLQQVSRGGPCSRGVPAPGGVWRRPPQQMATVADGTHPTGMHSCLYLFCIWRNTPKSWFPLWLSLASKTCYIVDFWLSTDNWDTLDSVGAHHIISWALR